MSDQMGEQEPPYFSEMQIDYGEKVLNVARETLESIEITEPFLTTEEKNHPEDNYFIIQKHDSNVELYLSIKKPEGDFGSALTRALTFDQIMNKLNNAGIKLMHHSTFDKNTKFTSWEFIAVATGYDMTETVSQANVLEICEMIAKKIGVDLDIS